MFCCVQTGHEPFAGMTTLNVRKLLQFHVDVAESYQETALSSIEENLRLLLSKESSRRGAT
jgi:hypothetical protein